MKRKKAIKQKKDQITLYVSQEQENEWNKACIKSMGNIKYQK